MSVKVLDEDGLKYTIEKIRTEEGFITEDKFDELLKSHIETIREALGIFNDTTDGLVPKSGT